MYGSNNGRDWIDEQIDAALDAIDREDEAIFLAWIKQRAAPEPQQLDFFRSTHWLKQADNQLMERLTQGEVERIRL